MFLNPHNKHNFLQVSTVFPPLIYNVSTDILVWNIFVHIIEFI